MTETHVNTTEKGVEDRRSPYDQFVQVFKGSNAITQLNYVKGVDKNVDISVLKSVKPVRFDSFKDVNLTCAPGDWLACIVKHKKNGTVIKYGRAMIKKPWEKDGHLGVACGLDKQFYFNDNLYDITDIYVWKLKTIEVDWADV